MPYKDREKRIAKSKEWRDKKIKEGYGRALYARRVQRFRNEEILRAAVSDAIARLHDVGESEIVDEVLDDLIGALTAAAEVKGKPLDFMPKENHEQATQEDS
ncbi:MAG TPA: hypothetical protein VNN79_05995 [Actinomycetota bacterium]|nr:hypothetical protein [Actinomycetota bacterium]